MVLLSVAAVPPPPPSLLPNQVLAFILLDLAIILVAARLLGAVAAKLGASTSAWVAGHLIS